MSEFDDWLSALKDRIGKARIAQRLDSAAVGSFGDASRLVRVFQRCDFMSGRPGYRAYFTRIDEVIYLLLVGGDKSSQKCDIKRALEMASILKRIEP